MIKYFFFNRALCSRKKKRKSNELSRSRKPKLESSNRKCEDRTTRIESEFSFIVVAASKERKRIINDERICIYARVPDVNVCILSLFLSSISLQERSMCSNPPQGICLTLSEPLNHSTRDCRYPFNRKEKTTWTSKCECKTTVMDQIKWFLGRGRTHFDDLSSTRRELLHFYYTHKSAPLFSFRSDSSWLFVRVQSPFPPLPVSSLSLAFFLSDPSHPPFSLRLCCAFLF